MNITQGDSGTVIELTVLGEKNTPIDLTDCNVTFKFKNASKPTFEKNAEITDAVNGLCQTVMLSTDLDAAGKYEFQATVIFPNTNKFSTKIMKFDVDKSL